MRYYRTIDGLRAIAVLLVFFYHLEMPLFSGGFVGVDVFFVISGYLITSILLEGIDKRRFSIVDFYERRARRILPLSITMTMVVLVVGALVFDPHKYRELASSGLAATFFVSNVQFWLSSGYFDHVSEFNPFLHTWSLSVEEQFYLLYPLFLYLVAKRRRRTALFAVGLVTLVSFASSVVGARFHPDAAFYLPHTRYWEFMMGALLVLNQGRPVAARTVRELSILLGIGLIISSGMLLDSSSPFPGWRALPPCLGTCLVIYCIHGGSTYAEKLLGSRLAVGCGLISYSLYMWHWPMIVFFKYLFGRSPTLLDSAAILIVALALSVFTWRFIETPFRKRTVVPETRVFVTLLLGGTILITGLVISLKLFPQFAEGDLAGQHKIPGREFYNVRTCFLEPDQGHVEWNIEKCRITDSGDSVTVLWGDSYAAHYAPGISRLANRIDSQVVQYTAGECPPVFGIKVRSNIHCEDFNAHLKQVVRDSRADTVIIAARWERYLNAGEVTYRDIRATLNQLPEELGVQVVLIAQSPVFSYRDPYYLYKLARSEGYRTGSSYYYPIDVPNELNERLAGVSKGVFFIDPIANLCKDSDCPVYLDGEFMVIDNGHLSAYASEIYFDSYLKILALQGFTL